MIQHILDKGTFIYIYIYIYSTRGRDGGGGGGRGGCRIIIVGQ